MSTANAPDWEAIRQQAGRFPDAAYQFIREGLCHTAKMVHGDEGGRDDTTRPQNTERPRHISGQQLCLGLRDLAVRRYGLLAGTVLRRWGMLRTEDFGIIVYALIDRGEMRSSPQDSFDDFRDVFDFEEAFAPQGARDAT